MRCTRWRWTSPNEGRTSNGVASSRNAGASEAVSSWSGPTTIDARTVNGLVMVGKWEALLRRAEVKG